MNYDKYINKCILFEYLAQESSGTQGVLGPTKIYLAVQPPDPPSPPVQKPVTVASVTAQPTVKSIEPTPTPPVPVSNNVPEKKIPPSLITETVRKINFLKYALLLNPKII